MPMLEYVEGCMANDGNYSYMSGYVSSWWCDRVNAETKFLMGKWLFVTN